MNVHFITAFMIGTINIVSWAEAFYLIDTFLLVHNTSPSCFVISKLQQVIGLLTPGPFTTILCSILIQVLKT